MSAPLYEIAAVYRADLALLADLDLDAQTVADTLEGMQGEIRDKLRAVIAYALDMSVLASGTSDAAKRMTVLAHSRQSRADGLMKYALDTMVATGIADVSTDEFAARVAKKPPSVLIADGALVPAAYLRTATTITADKVGLKAALVAGASMPGISLVQGFRLAVR